MDNNQKAYSSEKTVEEYTKHEALQKGELSIIEQFKTKINNGKVLDIGVGGGRTTSYLVPLSKEYTGVDFSIPFVNLCNARYGSLPHVTIQYGDARDLNGLGSQSFDFIFFSFNGIDYVNFDDRKKILSEFLRLLKTDGVLSFSFHNKGNLDMLYSFQFPRNPLKYLWEWERMRKVRKINGSKENYKNKDWFIIKDGGLEFVADTFYIDPVYQQHCLEEAGFKTFYYYNAHTGERLTISEAQNSNMPWIYVAALK